MTQYNRPSTSRIISFQNEIIGAIETVVDRKLAKFKVGNTHYGVIDSVVDNARAYVFVDASTTSQLIPTNPDVTFTNGDHVFVEFINGRSIDAFVTGRRIIRQ